MQQRLPGFWGKKSFSPGEISSIPSCEIFKRSNRITLVVSSEYLQLKPEPAPFSESVGLSDATELQVSVTLVRKMRSDESDLL